MNHNPVSHQNTDSPGPLLSPAAAGDEKLTRRSIQRSRAGRPLKHKTPKEKQTAHSKSVTCLVHCIKVSLNIEIQIILR